MCIKHHFLSLNIHTPRVETISEISNTRTWIMFQAPFFIISEHIAEKIGRKIDFFLNWDCVAHWAFETNSAKQFQAKHFYTIRHCVYTVRGSLFSLRSNLWFLSIKKWFSIFTLLKNYSEIYFIKKFENERKIESNQCLQ